MIRLERFLKYALIELIFALALLSGFLLSLRKFWGQVTVKGNWPRMILGIGAVSIALVSISAVLLTYLDWKIERKVTDQLTSLVRGNFTPLEDKETSVSILELPFSLRSYHLAVQEIRKKLMSLTAEVQELSAQPQLVAGESKQDILEEERHRIARELHDSVSQQLFAAMMLLATLTEEDDVDPEIVHQQLGRIEEIVNEAQIEMRALLLHLRPVKLENQSLKNGIIGLLKELENKVNMAIHWQVDDIHLRPGNEDDLFRIVQEIISNTLRHARAKSLEVYLKDYSSQISLRIIDNGVGFDPTLQKNHGNYGLQNIRERVESMGGKLSIVSFKGKGTTVDIRIPKTLMEEAES